ncbi:hypothetical protein BGZ76_011267 [Entomortierella beljakovae]|nr:hypothetical protein BGZ76_011267 [Entomortierella beljakovae]
MLVNLVGALTLALTLIGHLPSYNHGYCQNGIAMAMPIDQAKSQNAFIAPISYLKDYDQSDYIMAQQNPTAIEYPLNHQKANGQHKTTPSRESVKKEKKKKEKRKKKKKKQQQQHKDQQDIYQERFLDFASRVSGNSRKQVEEMVYQENMENDNGEKWIKEYEERDAREKRRKSAQEERDEEVGMFAYYIGKNHNHHYYDHHHLKFQDNLILKANHQIQKQSTENNVIAIEKSEFHNKEEVIDSTVVKFAWVLDQGKDRDKIKDKDSDKDSGTLRIGSTQYKQIPKSTPAIFYVPHQDDDALAMALSIREHVESGRKVIVHLYSDGVNPLLRDIVAGDAPCTLQHNPIHKQNLTLEDVVTGRTHEFRNSLRALGVKDEDIFETGWSDVEPFLEYDSFKAKLQNLIVGYEKKYPGASHKCISGEYDTDSTGRNPTHRACWDVATQLVDEHPGGWPSSKQLWDLTYTFYKPKAKRTAQYTHSLPQYLHHKQRALDQYKRWDPASGELAWGYHSVKTLIDASYSDPLLYIDMLDIDPVNPENWDSNEHIKQKPRINKKGKDTGSQSSCVETKELKHAVAPEMTLVEQVTIVENEDHSKWSEKEIHAQKEFLDSYQQAAKRPEGRGYQVGQAIKIKIGLGL